jgi:malonate transporter
MFSTLTIVLPIFALILAGWLTRRLGVFGAQATSEISRFVIYLALPALLFDIVAGAHWSQIWQPGFIAAFGLGCLLTFAAALLIRLRARPLADAAIDGLNAGYANVGFIGFPLALAAIGRSALAPTLVATIVTVCGVFAFAIVLIEIGLGGESRSGARLARKVAVSLLKNPLLVAPVLGALVPLSGQAVPASVETFLKLLGGAASPCALVGLGLFLAEKRPSGARTVGPTALLVAFKLLLQPGLTWVLAALVFRLPPLLTHTAVLLAALPTGTGPFMLAELYGREADVTSDVILVSTVLSLATVTGYLLIVG